MKIINLVIIIIGVLFLIARSISGYLNDEALIYNFQFGYVKLFFYKWFIFAASLTMILLLFVNIIRLILENGKQLKSKRYTQIMMILFMLTGAVGLFTYSENADAILFEGWTGLFHFPFFWHNLLFLIFLLLLPKSKEYFRDHPLVS